jgi:hypothetical protein
MEVYTRSELDMLLLFFPSPCPACPSGGQNHEAEIPIEREDRWGAQMRSPMMPNSGEFKSI